MKIANFPVRATPNRGSPRYVWVFFILFFSYIFPLFFQSGLTHQGPCNPSLSLLSCTRGSMPIAIGTVSWTFLKLPTPRLDTQGSHGHVTVPSGTVPSWITTRLTLSYLLPFALVLGVGRITITRRPHQGRNIPHCSTNPCLSLRFWGSFESRSRDSPIRDRTFTDHHEACPDPYTGESGFLFHFFTRPRITIT